MKLGRKQQAWVDALRSGRYAQTQGSLRDDTGYCCLGVACEVAGLPAKFNEYYIEFTYEGENAILPRGLVESLAMKNHTGVWLGTTFPPLHGKFELSAANDAGATFTEIADFIERYPEAIFNEPR